MSNFFDNLMTGFTFGMLANNPFFGGCFGFGMYGGLYNNRVDFGGFANSFPSVFGSMGNMSNVVQLPPSTFANQSFPTINFAEVGECIWDTFMNPDSEYNKQLRNYYEQINKQYEESKKDSNKSNNNNPFQMPFSQIQTPINPWAFINIPGVTNYDSYTRQVTASKSNKKESDTAKSVDLEPDERDSEVKRENTQVISYDSKQLKAKWTQKQPQLTDKFYSRVVDISKKIKCSPDDLMALMNLETRRTFSPSEKCGKSSATGLIQFTDAAAKTLGTTTAKLKKMSAVEQLDYVEKYFIHWKTELGIEGQQLSAGDLYALVAQPANAKKEVLIKAGTKAYADNAKNWDINNDKKITKSDLAACLDKFRA